MLSRIAILLFVATLGAIEAPFPLIVSLQLSPNQVRITGSARVVGRVVAADDGRPVRRASVSLSGLPDSQRNAGPTRGHFSLKAETDVEGRFEFAELPSGSYTINVDAQNGFVRLGWPREFLLADGRVFTLTIRLRRTGAVVGRIHDENGDALLRAEVYAVRRFDIAGYTAISHAVASATTDDLGEFRLFNLPAAEYYVLATRIPTRGHHEPTPQSGYCERYYPGASALPEARPVAVRAGRDTRDVNFSLAPCRLLTVSVDPVDSRSNPLGREAHLTLTRRAEVSLKSSMRSTSRREDGTFKFEGVPPGEYSLGVATSYRKEEGAYRRMRIGEQDVSISIRTNPGATVSGRALVDGQPVGSNTPAGVLNVSVSASTPLGYSGPSYGEFNHLAQLRGSDRFELNGLRGPVRLWADVSAGALLSMQHGGEEIALKPLEFDGTENITDVIVSLTTKVASVDVTVVGAGTAEEPDSALLVLFSENPRFWGRGHAQFTRTAALREGSKTVVPSKLSRMPGGRYLIVAIPDVDLPNPTDARVLEKLRPFAVPITLTPEQTAKVTVKVANLRR